MTTWIILVLVGLVVLLYFFKDEIAKLLGPADKKSLPYKKRDYLLTKAERLFYEALTSAVEHKNVLVFAKVRLGDLLYLPSNTKERMSYLNKITAKHVDFLLCDSASVRPVLAIELNDSSHNHQSRAERDAFLVQALTGAGLPLLTFPAKAAYNPQELCSNIDKAIADKACV